VNPSPPLNIPLALRDQPWFADPAGPAGFHNPWGAGGARGLSDVLKWQLARNPLRAAKRRRYAPRVQADPLDAWGALPAAGRAMWLGHASALVEIDGVRALIDPVLGRINGVMARKARPPLRIDQLPRPDAVLITHGHFDHLDAPSLRALAKAFGPELPFVVPLGLARALPAACREVVELGWWQTARVGSLSVALVPAQHWHRRGAFDTNRALWGGYVLRGSRSVYHSGDTGWFGGFEAIGAVFPDIDLAILPMGAYEPRWFMGAQHMAPEDTVRALEALGARRMMAMHWGTFDLNDEPLDHGPRDLLPGLLVDRGLDPDRCLVMAHGGAIDLASGEAAGRVSWR
jgi:L-ascorbate metabolism protein UlaG (beta-lactamase superfamily)